MTVDATIALTVGAAGTHLGGKMAIGDKELRTGRYWNTNGFGIAIVAVITEGIDWAAYIGATGGNAPEAATVAFVAAHGAKLSRRHANHIFEDIRLPYRE